MLLLLYFVPSLISIVLQSTVRISLLWLYARDKCPMAYFVGIWDYVMSLAFFKLKVLLTLPLAGCSTESCLINY
jgi:hypothetical protein